MTQDRSGVGHAIALRLLSALKRDSEPGMHIFLPKFFDLNKTCGDKTLLEVIGRRLPGFFRSHDAGYVYPVHFLRMGLHATVIEFCARFMPSISQQFLAFLDADDPALRWRTVVVALEEHDLR